jgi:hypothetical protein
VIDSDRNGLIAKSPKVRRAEQLSETTTFVAVFVVYYRCRRVLFVHIRPIYSVKLFRSCRIYGVNPSILHDNLYDPSIKE